MDGPSPVAAGTARRGRGHGISAGTRRFTDVWPIDSHQPGPTSISRRPHRGPYAHCWTRCGSRRADPEATCAARGGEERPVAPDRAHRPTRSSGAEGRSAANRERRSRHGEAREGEPSGQRDLRRSAREFAEPHGRLLRRASLTMSLIHISEPTRLLSISYAV